jgi:murein DD-endopeptidase MepM/ murein hydrolase activator NlpD
MRTKLFIPLLAVLLLAGCGRVSVPVIPAAPAPTESPALVVTSSAAFVQPLDRPSERTTKKKFGTYITPQNSPVQPERFSGYHTGVDYETFPDEQNVDVPVRAVCAGQLLVARSASGYGGVAVQSCVFDNNSITIVYGHLRLSSIVAKVGDQLAMGQQFAILGTSFSSETDGERKHLHLGIHQGSSVDIRGYVAAEADLASWLNPADVLP